MSDTTPFVDSLSTVSRATPTPSAVDSLKACYFYVGGVLAALAAAAVLVATSADAQTTGPAPSAAAAPQAADTPTTPPNIPKPPPRYGASDIERAFNFMDINKDGKISRQEAAGFRNVAKHFDAADTGKDGTLSLGEFGNALNHP